MTEELRGKKALQALEDCEVDNSRKRNTAPNGTDAVEHLMVAEREYHAREPHHKETHDKGDNHRHQNRRDNHQSLARVDKVRHIGQGILVR